MENNINTYNSDQKLLDKVNEEARSAEIHDDFKKLPIPYEELEESCEKDEILMELFRSMINQCLLYTKSVIEFNIFVNNNGFDPNSEEFITIDNSRKVTHDATIDSINILARNLKQRGGNSDWIKSVSQNRAQYARFAVLMGFARILKDKDAA